MYLSEKKGWTFGFRTINTLIQHTIENQKWIINFLVHYVINTVTLMKIQYRNGKNLVYYKKDTVSKRDIVSWLENIYLIFTGIQYFYLKKSNLSRGERKYIQIRHHIQMNLKVHNLFAIQFTCIHIASSTPLSAFGALIQIYSKEYPIK